MSLKGIKKASTLSQLAAELLDAAAHMKDDMNKLTKWSAFSITRRLIYETPVDESTALSNWQVSLNYAPKSAIPAYFKGEGGSTYPESTSLAVMEAYGEIQRRRFGNVINITNNARHIVELERGKSPQAEAGFIKNIVNEEYVKLVIKLQEYANGN